MNNYFIDNNTVATIDLSFKEASYMYSSLVDTYNFIFNNNDILFEDVIKDSDDSKNKILLFFEKIWKSIKNLFTKAIEWIKGAIKDFQTKLLNIGINNALNQNNSFNSIKKEAIKNILDIAIKNNKGEHKEKQDYGKIANYNKFIGKNSDIVKHF